ncbi:hypothetical protein DSO57_1000807 [Entomophthora muscae]|uniref:Uncharacterized protein n=1 Tax=Entomophthora muscae TaxID=34485 RepID=A0ACC2U7C1_9FUNG|nr:hypothetical protein DSO57_1000807 [Entomophthora muscae]
MPNAYPVHDENFSYLKSPMKIDTPSGVSHYSNQPIDEANTPKEIADIEAIIAALNQRVHQQFLDGNKQWAMPVLPRPCPKVTESVKAPKVEISLEDLLRKSPNFCQTLTKAVAALVPHSREKLLLSGKGL